MVCCDLVYAECRALVFGGSICTASDVAVRLGKLSLGRQELTSGDIFSAAFLTNSSTCVGIKSPLGVYSHNHCLSSGPGLRLGELPRAPVICLASQPQSCSRVEDANFVKQTCTSSAC